MYLNMRCDRGINACCTVTSPRATMQTVLENAGWGRRGERCAFLMLEIVMNKLVKKSMIPTH